MPKSTRPPETPKTVSGVGTASGISIVTGVGAFRIHKPLPEDHPFYSLIGKIASEWAHLEHALDLLIWDLIEAPHQVCACVTAQIMGATPRFNTLIALATWKQKDEKIIEQIRSLMRKTYDIQEARNRIAHDPWYIETQSDAPGQFKSMPRSSLDYGLRDVDEKYIKETIRKIRARAESIRALWNPLMLKPAP
jgi:hypothetical protein